MQILDLSDPANPLPLGSIDLDWTGTSVALWDRFACVTDFQSGHFGSRGSLYVVDVANPQSPAIRGKLELARLLDLAIAGKYALICSNSGDGLVVSLSNPSMPDVVRKLPALRNATAVEVSGPLAYFLDRGDLVVADVSRLPDVDVLYSVTLPDWGHDVVVAGDYVYVAAGDAGLFVLHDLVQPQLIAEVDTPGHAEVVRVQGTHAYIGDSDSGVWVVDVSDPANPTRLGVAHAIATALDVDDSYAYASYGYSGLGFSVLPTQCEERRVAHAPILSGAEPRLEVWPNPLRKGGEIRFTLGKDRTVALRLYDVGGRLLRTLAQGPAQAGTHRVLWDGLSEEGEASSAGVYFLRLDSEDGPAMRSVLLSR
jgi:hypothetical protein